MRQKILVLNSWLMVLHFYCRWSQIAKKLPGRTDNDIKNLWNTKLRKRLEQQAILENSSNLQTPIINHYNFLANNYLNLLLQTILNMPIPQEATMATSLNQDYSWPQLQTIDPILPLLKPACCASDAWFQGGSHEHSFFNSIFCNEIDTTEYSKLPELMDDEIPVEFYVNGAVNKMNYEFRDPSSPMRVSPLFMEDASTSIFYIWWIWLLLQSSFYVNLFEWLWICDYLSFAWFQHVYQNVCDHIYIQHKVVFLCNGNPFRPSFAFPYLIFYCTDRCMVKKLAFLFTIFFSY